MPLISKVDYKTCYHCGTSLSANRPSVANTAVYYDEKAFCCEGCRTVYELLKRELLDDYYSLFTGPGISPHAGPDSRFDYLDDPDVAASLLDFREGNLAKVTFHIPQMHCISCIWLLEKLYTLHAGVSGSYVNFPKKELYISFDPGLIPLRALVALLARLGYEPAITLADQKEKRPPASRMRRKLYYQLGVAGFCFGNIMLLSLPEYFDAQGVLPGLFKTYFGALNILLALPVLLYADLDYFRSAWQSLRKGHINLDFPLALGMVALFSVSLVEILTATGPGYMDSFTGLVFFLLTGRAFQHKTFDHLSFERNYASYLPISATVMDGDALTSRPIEKLNPGDRILVRSNEIIPADAILLRGQAWIDYSFVSGEAAPVEKTLGEIVHAGGRQLGGSMEMEVVKGISRSYFTSLWNQYSSDKKEEYLFNIANRAGRNFTYAILLISVSAFLWYLPDWGLSAKIFASVLIVACPCALALSSPYAFGNVIRILGKNGFYLKNAAVVEALARTDAVVFDKTGTLTRSDSFEVSWHGRALDETEKMAMKAVMAQSVHPLSRAIALHLDAPPAAVTGFEEKIGGGVCGHSLDREVKAGSLGYVLEGQSEDAAGETRVYVALNGRLSGYFVLKSTFRQELTHVLQALSATHKLSVCSGDAARDRKALEQMLPGNLDCAFNQSPLQKMDFVRNLQLQGHHLIMVGDGLNDAGALRKSDVGVAVSEDSGQFTPASDGILDAREFSRFPRFLKLSRWAVRIVYMSFVLSASYNLIGVGFAVTGNLTPVVAAILMPLSSITIVLFTTGATTLAARKLKLK